MVVELTTASSVVSFVCVHGTVVSSSKQQHIQRASRCLNVAAGSLMPVVCIVSVI